ncbi:MAG: hypothetical protein KBA62_04070 [Polaromonas sp.]|nr:hypothetical protein [Polaromonas sp.]
METSASQIWAVFAPDLFSGSNPFWGFLPLRSLRSLRDLRSRSGLAHASRWDATAK